MPITFSGADAVKTILYAVAFFGTMHLLAASMPNSKVARAWVSLGF